MGAAVLVRGQALTGLQFIPRILPRVLAELGLSDTESPDRICRWPSTIDAINGFHGGCCTGHLA